MVKNFKHIAVASLPPNFFSMINSIAIALMAVAKEDLVKIVRFVRFWIEKIELEVVDEDEFEYPKFLLRNTLCHLHNELGNYDSCLTVSSVNVKEISNNVGSVEVDEKRQTG